MSISALLFAAAASGCTGTFESHITPGEGRPHYETLAGEIELYSEASTASALAARVSPPERTRFESEDIRYRTLTPIVIPVTAELRIRGRSFGCISELSREDYYRGQYPEVDVTLPAGSAFEYLHYRAEGTCFIRVDGAVVDTDDACPYTGSTTFDMREQPNTELWIRTTLEGMNGWVRIDEVKTHERCREPYSCEDD